MNQPPVRQAATPPVNGMLSVDVHDLTKKFGDFTAVDDVSFQIPRGSIFGFLGPNGAGKSTTIRMLLGIIVPTAGRGTVLGYDILTQSELIRAKVGYMSQLFSLYRDLTVYENLDFFSGIFNLSGPEKKKRLDTLIELTRLQQYTKSMTADLPRGIRQRLSFAVSLIHDPEIVFLDEPTGGVDPALRRYFWDVIVDLAQMGKTIMVTTHYMDEVERCDTICIIYTGKIIAQGSPGYLKKHYISGGMYEIETEQRLEVLEVLQGIPGVKNAYPSGRTVRFIVQPGGPEEGEIVTSLTSAGVRAKTPAATPATLEDVFISLVLGYQKEK